MKKEIELKNKIKKQEEKTIKNFPFSVSMLDLKKLRDLKEELEELEEGIG